MAEPQGCLSYTQTRLKPPLQGQARADVLGGTLYPSTHQHGSDPAMHWQPGIRAGCPSSAAPQSIPWNNIHVREEGERPEPSIPLHGLPGALLEIRRGPASPSFAPAIPAASRGRTLHLPVLEKVSVGSGGRVRPRRLSKAPALPELLPTLPDPLCNLLMHGWSSCLRHGRSRIMGASFPPRRCSRGIWLR